MDASTLDRSHLVLVVTSAINAVSLMFLVSRLTSRVFLVKATGVEDWILLLAWILALGLSIAICVATQYGLGVYHGAITVAHEATLRRLIYTFDLLYNPAMMATKSSILVQYSRLFSSNLVFKRFNYATLAAVLLGYTALTLVNAFQCRPPDAVFRSFYMTENDQRCTSILTIYLASAPLNISTDIAILLLPMPLVRSLRIPRKQKIILVVTFGVGLFATIVDTVRIMYLQKAVSANTSGIHHPPARTLKSATGSPDFYWNAAFSLMWSAIEVHVGIVCACVPAMKPIIVRLLPRLILSTTDLDRTVSLPGSTANTAHPTTSNPIDSPHVWRQESVDTRTERISRSRDRPVSTTTRNVHFYALREIQTPSELSGRDAIRPSAVFTLLFFIWGLEYGWLDILNSQFQATAAISDRQTSALHSAYYIGYLFGPTCIGYFTIHRWGLKATAVVGLAIYACGTLIFWPAAVLASFPGCFITNFIVGFGLSNLEVSANTFIVLCGPSRYGASRLCLSQGCQAVGSLVAILIANATFAKPDSSSHPSLVQIQWMYLGMAFSTVALAMFLFLQALPDIHPDHGRQETSSTRLKVSSAFVVATLGVLAQFCYVGGQEVNATSLTIYADFTGEKLHIVRDTIIVHSCFALSRLVASGVAIFVRPRLLLLIFAFGTVLFQAIATIPTISGNARIIMVTMVFFLEGPIFPLLFTTVIQEMGRQTRIVAVAMTSAISGGAVFSPIASILSQHSEPRSVLFLVLSLFCGCTVFSSMINVSLTRWSGRPNRPTATSREERGKGASVIEIEFSSTLRPQSDESSHRLT